jgi:hypothetical protein
MADATIAVTAGRVSNLLDLTAFLITVTYSSTSYATASNGLPFDIAAVLNAAGPQPVNYKDVIGLLPIGPTAEAFIIEAGTFTIGTVTGTPGAYTAVPCTVQIRGTGSANKAALTEVDDAALSGSFKALLLVAKGGVN